MKQLVIMPGGFHPFHAGHLALYQSAEQAFPGADVKVAATNDTSARPFPFKLKEKLAQLAGVPPGKFYQVKSPFRADEITKSYNPADTQLIFVRSEKDADKPPVAGATKKDGTPAYLQPISDDMAPMTQHAYMAYLPTVEFGPGITSATEIRNAWPKLNEKRKLALVMSLYPATQSNEKLGKNVVAMLDSVLGGQQDVAEGGAETSWSNDTDTITLQDILELTKHIKQINLPINDNLKSKLLHWEGNPEEIERVNQVTVSNQFPILIMVDEQGQIAWILDGNHRLHKAIQSQAKTIPAKLIRPSSLDDKAKKIFNIKEQGMAEGALDEGVNDPHIFKAIAMIGPMGAGKSTIARQLVGGSGLRSLNLDNFNELLIKKGKVAGGNLTPDQLERSWQLTQAQKDNWVTERLGLLIDGSGRNVEGLVKPLTELEKLGYDTMVILVNVSLETSLQRQQSRAAQQTAQYGAGRNVPLDLAKSSYEQIQQNIPKLQQLYGNRLLIINNERAADLSQEQSIVSKFLNSPPSSPAAVQWIKSHGQSQGQQLDNRLAQQQRQAASAQRAPAYKSNAKSAAEVVDEAGNQTNDSELNAIKTYARRHYPNLAADPESAFDKWVQRSLMHSNVDDHEMDQKIRRMAAEIAGLKTKIQSLKQQANDTADYLDESR